MMRILESKVVKTKNQNLIFHIMDETLKASQKNKEKAFMKLEYIQGVYRLEVAIGIPNFEIREVKPDDIFDREAEEYRIFGSPF